MRVKACWPGVCVELGKPRAGRWQTRLRERLRQPQPRQHSQDWQDRSWRRQCRSNSNPDVCASNCERRGKCGGGGRSSHHPDMADYDQRRLRNAPDTQRQKRSTRCALGGAHKAKCASKQKRKNGIRSKHADVNRSPTHPVPQKTDGTKRHHCPPHLRTVQPYGLLEHVGEIGIGTKHRRKHQYGKNDVPQHQRISQDHGCLRNDMRGCGPVDSAR
ncbi:hypothetical protein M2315_004558 [Agrobacterium fabrum]|nr:hypothetical protein [Agrobacterium fabrum]